MTEVNDALDQCRVALKSGILCAIKTGQGFEAELKNRGMEEDEREGGFCGRRLEEKNVTVWEEAASEA